MTGMTYAVRRSYWTDIIRRCNQSGMVKSEWMRQNNISEKSFYYWQKKLRDEAAMMVIEDESIHLPDTTDNRFVELPSSHVIPTQSSCPVTLQKVDLRVELNESVSDEFLMRILKAVHHA